MILFDQLYQMGFRPSQPIADSSQHLQDMRKIVSKNLGVEL